ncbi:hypothetical protein L2E82_45052 [Cichorium intybus]|uniref:Uncharacterized protein n=1 Tax=Cichorium intybus TaxID=13427 RepID=A0ACB8ZR20_CICIN|nr:hypothetical protein L2E82_45052 [Cichorium intybus]
MTSPNCISTSYAMFRKFVDDNEFVWKLGRYMDHCGLNDSILCSRFLLTGVKVGLEAVDPGASSSTGKSYSNEKEGCGKVFSLDFNLRLWQDDENRTLLTNMLIKNSSQRPKILTIEDKLMVLGCKDLERRILETEMEITLANTQVEHLKTGPFHLSVIAERTKLTVEDHEPPERQKALLGALRFIWSSVNNYWVVRVRLCHFIFGRTPPCSESLIRTKVKKWWWEWSIQIQLYPQGAHGSKVGRGLLFRKKAKYKICRQKMLSLFRYDLHSESKETCGNLDDLATCVEYSNETGNT